MTINLAPDHHPPIKLTDQERALLAIARRVAEDSPDRSRKTGAVIVDESGQIVTTGYNTLPLGVEPEDRYLVRPAKYDWTEHAERNAIFEAARTPGKSTGGCEMIVPWFPCVQCARAIVQAGITRLVSPYPDVTDPNWGEEFKTALDILEKGKVKFDHFIDDRPPPKPVAEGEHVEQVVRNDRLPAQAWIDHWNCTQTLLVEEQEPSPAPKKSMRRR